MTCGEVGGSVSAMGHVECANVGGGITTLGPVSYTGPGGEMPDLNGKTVQAAGTGGAEEEAEGADEASGKGAEVLLE
ncbi:hypothetical protein D3C78_1898820 [compost metagenome]